MRAVGRIRDLWLTADGKTSRYGLGKRYQASYAKPTGGRGTKTFDRKRDAQAWLDNRTADVSRGDWIDPVAGNLTVEVVARRWLAVRVGDSQREKGIVENHVIPAFGDWPISKLSRPEIQSVIAEYRANDRSGSSASSLKKFLGVLRSICDYAIDAGIIRSNPADRISVGADERTEHHFIDHHQLNDLCGSLPEHWHAYVTAAFLTGMRWSELAGLRAKRVDLLRNRIEVAERSSEKGGRFVVERVNKSATSHRMVPIVESLRPILAVLVAERGPDDLVFAAEKGGPVRHKAFHRAFDGARRLAPSVPDDLRFHDLRHSCAAALVAADVHPKVIQRWLGHSSITVTLDTYGHLYDDAMDAAAEALDALSSRQNVAKTWQRGGGTVIPLLAQESENSL